MTDPRHSPIFASTLEVDPRVLCRENGFALLKISSEDFNSKAESAEIHGDLLVELKVISTRAESFWVKVNYEGSQILTCSRRLKPFKHSIKESFDFLLKYSDDVKNWKLEDEKEDYPVLLVHPQAKEFSVFEMVRQEILLNEPLSPVENPEEEFGWNDPELKEEDKVDPRWAKLLELKKNKDKK